MCPHKKFHYIYIVVRFDGKYYIGMHSTDNLEDGYFGSGKYLRRSINKHGIEKHTKHIIEFLPNRQALREREMELVNEECLNDVLCMNLTLGGEKILNPILSKQWRRLGRKKQEEYFYKTLGENWRSILAKKAIKTRLIAEPNSIVNMRQQLKLKYPEGIWKNKKHTDETKFKMKETHKHNKHQQGISNSSYGTCWIYNETLKENKKIKKDELYNWHIQGWVKGRKMK